MSVASTLLETSDYFFQSSLTVKIYKNLNEQIPLISDEISEENAN